MRRLGLVALLTAALGFAPGADAADPTPIGFVGTFSGSGSVVGRDALDGFNMALAQLTDRFGGVEVEVLWADDRQRPDYARQAAQHMAADGVRLFVTASAQPAANAAATAPALAAKGFVLSVTEAPPELAGKACQPNYFSLAATSLGEHAAMAQYFDSVGYRDIWLVATDSEAGRRAVERFRSLHRGEIGGVTLVKPGQMSFAPHFAEIERAADSLDGLYLLLTGGMGVNFIRQFGARGLQHRIALFAPGSFLDQPYIGAMGEAVVDAIGAAPWVEDLEHPQSLRVAAEFEARYGRPPSVYAMLGYDAAMLLDSAFRVAAQDTATKDKAEAFRNALRRAEFTSVRGFFRFSSNHFPMQSWYLVQAARTARGRLGMQMRQVLLKEQRDPRAADCGMKWEDPLLAPPPGQRPAVPARR